MNTYFQDDYTSILHGDCIETMKEIRTGSVHCCVTSPPYFGLRDYGTGTWEGGDPECDHSCGGQVEDNKAKGAIQTGVRQGCDASKCNKCGAIRIDKQIGLENTPDAFVSKMVEVFREVRRVLRDDGTVWLNLGDSYAGSWGNAGGQNRGKGTQRPIAGKSITKDADTERHGSFVPAGARGFKDNGIKPKDLIGIPWRVAFALQQDGWYLRQDIIWHKPNPMPESVTDRCTKAHEYIFLLSKSEKYYYDSDAIKEPSRQESIARMDRGVSDNHKNTNGAPGQTPHGLAKGRPHKNLRDKGQSVNSFHSERANGSSNKQYENRNKRSVWAVTTKPYSGANFATFPPDLITPCILAGCPKDGTVLDPFGGSGTTADVAREHGRLSILCELNVEYIELMKKRLQQGVLSL